MATYGYVWLYMAMGCGFHWDAGWDYHLADMLHTSSYHFIAISRNLLVSCLSSGEEVKSRLFVETVAEQQDNFHGAAEVLVVMQILQGKSILKLLKHKPLMCREVV